MKNLASILLISFLVSLCSLQAFSDEEKRPTLVIFSADWCSNCKKAKEDINNNKELSETIKNYYVVVADFDIDKDLVEGYDVKKIPTFVVINKGSVTKKVGYQGPRDLNKFLK